MDAGLLPGRRARRRRRQAAVAREMLVQRLAPPEEAHDTAAVVVRVLVDVALRHLLVALFADLAQELLGSSSIDAFMSRVASRARSV